MMCNNNIIGYRVKSPVEIRSRPVQQQRSPQHTSLVGPARAVNAIIIIIASSQRGIDPRILALGVQVLPKHMRYHTPVIIQLNSSAPHAVPRASKPEGYLVFEVEQPIGFKPKMLKIDPRFNLVCRY